MPQSGIHPTDKSYFLEVLKVQEEDEEIKELLKGGIRKIFKGLTLGILHNRKEKSLLKEQVRGFEYKISGEIDSSEYFPSSEKVQSVMKDILDKVFDTLKQQGGLSEDGLKTVVTKVKIRFLMFWVLKLLEKSGFEHIKNIQQIADVPAELSMVIYDILKDKILTTLLIVLKSYGLVELSKNQINDYEVEEEIKILNINKKEVIGKLEGMGAKKVFEGTVHDEYFDYPEGQESLEQKGGIKSTFRIRTKIDKNGNREHFYTIKRKITPDEENAFIEGGILERIPEGSVKTKRCHEKEYRIKDIDLFRKILSGYGLVKSREKIKERVSYSLEEGNVKFDFDTYEGKQDMMEIEASKYSYVPQYIRALGLEKNPTATYGSRKFIADKNTDLPQVA